MTSEITNSFYKTLGEKIRKARTKRGISIGMLSKTLGVTRATVYHWEYGMHQPSIIRVTELHKALGVPLWNLLPTEEELEEEEI